MINLEKLFDLIYQQTVNRWVYYEKPKFDTKLFVGNRTGVYDYRYHAVYLSNQLDLDDPLTVLKMVHELRHGWQWKNYPILGTIHESFLLSPLYNPDFDAISPLEVDARLSEVEKEISGFLDDSSVDIYHKITCQDIRGIETYIRSAAVRDSFFDNLDRYFEIYSKLRASFGDFEK